MAPRVVLAGHNVDAEALARRLAGEPEQKAGALSPETLSAAYARISRDPRDVPELRADARAEVDQARKSNRAIIFQMGHASVAEHAVFNLDVMDLSRLAVEALERHRLASYTEKSQRYIRLEGAHVVPDEIAGGPFEADFRRLVAELGACYQRLASKLTAQAQAEAPAGAKRSSLESQANEDARYVLPLCATAQLGMTVNARTLELMIARTASHPLAEVQALSKALYAAVEHVAPSVIRYTTPTEYFRDTDRALADLAAECLPAPPDRDPGPVALVGHTAQPDRTVAAALLASASNCDWTTCRQAAEVLTDERLRELFGQVFRRMQPWDSLPRAFELVEFTFEGVVSAACFGQLKRHRMASLIAQPYETALGRTVPASITRVGLEAEFHATLDRSDALFERIAKDHPQAAPYALTNAHRRRVLFSINGRSLGHLARLRCDHEAQWDIRQVAHALVAEAQRVMPLAGSFYGGKDCFEDLRANLGLE